jgi:hypothetical protein
MKTLALSLLAIAGLALVGWQHQQLGQMRTENVTLQQSATEADQLKADLAKFNGAQAQDAAAEIDRLREENHDLLKLRNEVNQLRDTRAEFQKVSAENQRLRTQPRTAVQSAANQMLIQPIVVNINALYDRGLNTPEDAVQTCYWALRESNPDALARCLVGENSQFVRDYFASGQRRSLEHVVAIEIVARRELKTNSLQLGVILRNDSADRKWDRNLILTLTLRGGQWRVDRQGLL